MPRVITETFENHRIVRGPDGKGGYLLKLEQLHGYDAMGNLRWMSQGEFNADLEKSGKDGGEAAARMCWWLSSLVPLEMQDGGEWVRRCVVREAAR